MKPIGMPAFRLTSDCIWNSFRSSGKKHLILTGGRRSGKTTLLQRLFPEQTLSVTTWAIPREAVWLADSLTGQRLQIGVFDPTLPGTENLMVPIPSAFDTAAELLCAYAQCDSEWILIDEIGYLEASSRPYFQALLNLMEHKRLAAVVRKQELPHLKELLLHKDVFVVDMDDPFGAVGCVIMASGLGKRFGGNKLMADFRGKPMLQWVLEATDGIFAQRVVVTRHRDVRELCDRLQIPVILHDMPYRSDTVQLGTQAMAADLQGCFFCPGDQPLLTWDTVAALGLCAKNRPGSIWRTAHKNIPGSPVYFPSQYFPRLSSLPEGRGGNVIIRENPHNVSFLEVSDPLELQDIDTPETLEALLASL